MASRSPTRNRRPSATSTRTKYSINWDALRGPGSDASSLPDKTPKEQLEVIHSDEIDGPSDFTQNLEYWMRAPLTLNDAKQPNVTEPGVVTNGEIADDLAEYIDSEEHGDVEEDLPQTPKRDQLQVNGTAQRENTAQSPVSQQPHSRRSSMASLAHDEKVRSYLDALPDTEVPSILVESPSSATTARKAKSVRSLQPTVEDAEMTPRKPSSDTVIPPVDNLKRISELEAQLIHQTSESSEVIRRLQETLSVTSEELKKSQEQSVRQLEEAQEQQRRHSTAIANAQDRHSAELLETKTRHAEELENVREEATRQKAATSTQAAAWKDREQQLEQDLASRNESIENLRAELSAAEERHRAGVEERNRNEQTHDDEVANLRAQLVAAEERNRQLSQDRDGPEQVHDKGQDEENATLREQLAASQEHNRQMTQERNQSENVRDEELSIVRQRLSASEERIRALRESHDDALQSRDRELKTLRSQLSTSQEHGRLLSEAQEDARQARDDLRLARAELDIMRADKPAEASAATPSEDSSDLQKRFRELQSSFTELQDELMEKDSKHKKEMSTLRTRAEDGIKQIGGLLESEKAEKLRFKKEVKALKAEIAQQTTALEQTLKHKDEVEAERISQEGISALKIAIETQTSTLTSMRLELHNTKTQLSSTQTELTTVREEFSTTKARLLSSQEDHEAVNRLFDERIQALMRERELRWKQKFETLLRERSQLGRALMHEWGKEECGKGEPQMYRYQFVQR